MRKEIDLNVPNAQTRTALRDTKTISGNGRLQGISHGAWPQAPAWYEKFLPHKESRLMSEQSKGGIFVPYPLLAILTPAFLILFSGVVALLVMIRMQQSEVDKHWQKIEQQQIYINDDREKLIKMRSDMDNLIREMDKKRDK